MKERRWNNKNDNILKENMKNTNQNMVILD